jgi:flagellar hook-length control protein FliK
MISNVAPKSTEAAGSSVSGPGESADTGDTGAFDALLALQSVIDEATVTDLTAQLAGQLEVAELPGALDDSDDTDDAEALPDDALWFLAAVLPTTQKQVTTAAAGSPASVPLQNDALPAASGGATSPAAGGAGKGDDLIQALALNNDTGGADSKLPLANAAAPAPAIDTTTWNSMTGPAEMFAHASRHAPERVESASLTTHVRDPRWADDLGNRLASMVRTGESSASLQLTPVDLGPLEVNVAVRDNQATVHFGAANAETRALLEASIPRLREMLAAQGFQLMDSSVSHGFARQTRHESAGTPRVDAIGESPSVSAAPVHITGLLDLYA